MSENPDDEPDEGAAPARELRGKDILTRSEAELAELALDPTELADLAQWFARPSHEVVVEAAVRRAPGDEEMDRRFDERQIRIKEACKAVDPVMIVRLERHDATARTFLRPIEGPAPFVDEGILQIRIPPPSEDAQIGDLRSYEREREVEEALTEAVPQAVLRDLYRSETQFDLRFGSPYADDVPEDPWVELRAAIRERREAPPQVATYAEAVAARRVFRTLTAHPWPESLAIVQAIRKARDAEDS